MDWVNQNKVKRKDRCIYRSFHRNKLLRLHEAGNVRLVALHCTSGITVPIMVVQTDATLGIGKATEYEKNIVEVTRDRKKVGGHYT